MRRDINEVNMEHTFAQAGQPYTQHLAGRETFHAEMNFVQSLWTRAYINKCYLQFRG